MPYNPGVINQVPQITMQGGKQWLDAMMGLAGNLDQLKKDDKAASALYDALTQEQPDPATGVPGPHPFKVNKDVWNAMSSKERVATAAGAMKGILFKQGLAEFKQKTDEAGQMMKLRTQQIASAKALTEGLATDRAQAKTFWDTFNQGMQPGTAGDANPMAPGQAGAPEVAAGTPDAALAFLNAARKAGGMPPAVAGDALRFLTQQEKSGQAGAGAPEMTTLGQVDTIFNRKTGQFQLSPYSKEAAKPEDGYIELPDPENPVFGPRIRLPLSMAEKKYPHLLKALSAADSTAAKAAPEAPKDPKTRKAGTIYKTPKGNLKWTGTGWVNP